MPKEKPKNTQDVNKVIHANAIDFMANMEENSVDLTVTSPPYDDLRIYKGYKFDYEEMALSLFRVTKQGGVVVWVVGDKIAKGNKTLTSFKQALYFQSVGFNVHDVMIYKKKNTPFMRSNAYTNCFEFMFVFSKGSPNTYNPIKEGTVRQGLEKMPANKKADGINNKVLSRLNEFKSRNNIWEYAVGMGGTTTDKIAFKHPAVFPEKLAEDHIISWTNRGDLVFDPMAGSGTTLKMALKNGRKFLGCDISEEYVAIAKERLGNVQLNLEVDGSS
jgi:site-specific DNA-methyltransferase (adenine-specific)